MQFLPRREEAQFRHGSHRLVGDLVLPPVEWAPGPVPAVVMVPGSGPVSGRQARDWEDIGARLATVGVAWFGYDKPGCGASTGDWTRMDFTDRAEETLAAVDLLASRPDIDASRIGLLGGSQGGWVAPLAASRRKSLATFGEESLSASRGESIAAIALISPPGVSVADCEEYQVGAEGEHEGYSPNEIEEAMRLYRRVLHRLRAGDSAEKVISDETPLLGTRVAELAEISSVTELEFFARIADYDPLPALTAVRCPVLAIYGENDVHVPAKRSAAIFEETLSRAGHDAYTIVMFPGADHRILVPDPDGGPHRRAPGLFELIVSWLDRTLRR
jgi:pimeloyl-ACP methyl ester carboxylesterase